MKRLLVLLLIFCALKGTAQPLKDCATCSTTIIKAEQLKGLSIDEIRLLTNEIFARNGHQFERSRFSEYFGSKPWYKSKGDNKSVVFNEIEKQNIKFFQDRTTQLKTGQAELVAQLKAFKALVLAGKTADLKSGFGFTYEAQGGIEEAEMLKSVFAKIDLDDINYYKNTGLNRVEVDNGFVKRVYGIGISGTGINISYNFMAHSEIIKDFDVYTDYHSESEFSHNWQFEFKTGKLRFVRSVVAG